MYFSIQRMIFHKAGHTLNFCINKTKMKLRLFRRCSFAKLLPVFLNGILIEFSNFANGKMNGPDALRVRLHALSEALS